MRRSTAIVLAAAGLCCASASPMQAASTGNFFNDLGMLLSGGAKPQKPASLQVIRVPGYGGQKKRERKVQSAPGNASASAGGFGGAVDDGNDEQMPKVRAGGGYRTMCVRLCDGYYWPISNAAYGSDLMADKRQCESSCMAPAKLFYQTDGGENPARMRSLDGKVYSKLKTAFTYRKSLEKSCRCKADPWSDSEILRHRNYALMPQVAAKEPSGPSNSDLAVAASLNMFDDGVASGVEIVGDSGLPDSN